MNRQADREVALSQGGQGGEKIALLERVGMPRQRGMRGCGFSAYGERVRARANFCARNCRWIPSASAASWGHGRSVWKCS